MYGKRKVGEKMSSTTTLSLLEEYLVWPVYGPYWNVEVISSQVILRDSIGDNPSTFIYDDVISSTYGKYSNVDISLTRVLLDERKAELDKENKKLK